MKVAIDTNVVLDFLMDREPWSEAAAQLFAASARGELEALPAISPLECLQICRQRGLAG